jgi:hypothetical protein
VAACGDDLTRRDDGLVRVSGQTPFADGCGGPGQGGVNRRSMEVEPSVAIDPTDPRHLIGAWQQDRWSSGASAGVIGATSFDGGATWTPSMAAISRCSGGDASNGGDYERATDPWVTFAADGTAWQIGLALDGTTARNAVRAARSIDGGRTWEAPTTLRADDDPDVFNDKESITADPTDAGRVYATWDRLTGLLMPTKPIGTGPTYFARTTGGVWEPARAIFDPGIDQQTIGNVIVVLPDGTLIDLIDVISMASTDHPMNQAAVLRSTDHGDTWSAPIVIATIESIGVHDVERDAYVRSGGILPEIAVDRASGALYVVWEDARFSGFAVNGLALSRSTDGGLTWSAPAQINQVPTVDAFDPAIAITSDGAVGVSYYDTRFEDGDAGSYLGAAFLITSRDAGATWTEEPLGDPFDLRAAAVGGVYFLGDYQGLVAAGTALVPFFAIAVDADDPTNIVTRPVD